MVTTLASVQINSSSHSGMLVSEASSDKLLFSSSDSVYDFSLIPSKISVTSSMILNATNQIKNVLATKFSSHTDRDSSITATSYSVSQSFAVNRALSSSMQTFVTTKVSGINGDLFTTHAISSEGSTSTNLLKQNLTIINSLRPVNLSDINFSTKFKRTVMISSVSPTFYTSKSLFSTMNTTIGIMTSVLHISAEKHSSVFSLSLSLDQVIASSMASTETSFSYSSQKVLKSHIQSSAFAISKQYLSIVTKSTPGSSVGGNATIEKSAVSKSHLLITTSSFKSRSISLHTNQLSLIFQTVDQIFFTRNTVTAHAALTLLPKETEVSKRGSSVIRTISTSSFNQNRFSESTMSRCSQKETPVLISFQDSKSSSTQKAEMSAAVEPTRKSVPTSFLTSTQSLVSLTAAVPRSKNETTSIPSSASAQSSASSTVAVPKSKNETYSVTSASTLSRTDKHASILSSTSIQLITSSIVAVSGSKNKTTSIYSSISTQSIASLTFAVPKSKNETTSIPSSVSTQSRMDKKIVSI